MTTNLIPTIIVATLALIAIAFFLKNMKEKEMAIEEKLKKSMSRMVIELINGKWHVNEKKFKDMAETEKRVLANFIRYYNLEHGER